MDGACVERWGIDDTVLPHLDNWCKPSIAQVPDRDDGVQDERGSARRLTDGSPFGVSSVRVEFHCQILNDFI